MLAFCVLMAGVGMALTGMKTDDDDPGQHSKKESLAAQGEERQTLRPASSRTSVSKFAVTIRRPTGPPRVATGLRDGRGQPVTVACSTCHATRQPNLQNKSVRELDEFHRELSLSHGNVSCLSCHNENDYDSLKLADGSRIAFPEVMTLCAQCHGPQMTAYEHGAHGGMTGFWDLSRGPQMKNNCVDCHDPHAPQFPKMHPTFKPRDRFLKTAH